MAQCVQSVQELVQDSFVPMVAVLCSEEAERVTRKNNLNFAELLRPFCRLTSEGKLPAPRSPAPGPRDPAPGRQFAPVACGASCGLTEANRLAVCSDRGGGPD